MKELLNLQAQNSVELKKKRHHHGVHSNISLNCDVQNNVSLFCK